MLRALPEVVSCMIFSRNARKIVNLNKKEEDIILKHMWGATIAPPKYKESYIVTMVDKYWAVKEAVTPLRNRIKNSKFFPSQDSTK